MLSNRHRKIFIISTASVHWGHPWYPSCCRLELSTRFSISRSQFKSLGRSLRRSLWPSASPAKHCTSVNDVMLVILGLLTNGFVVNTPSIQCLQSEWSDWVLSTIALNCPCSHKIGKTELLLEILFSLFTFHFVTKQRLPLKPLNVARCARFAGITWHKQSSWLDDSPRTGNNPQFLTG